MWDNLGVGSATVKINAPINQKHRLEKLAERGGFEPPIRLPVCRISSAVHSTALPPLRRFNGPLGQAAGGIPCGLSRHKRRERRTRFGARGWRPGGFLIQGAARKYAAPTPQREGGPIPSRALFSRTSRAGCPTTPP